MKKLSFLFALLAVLGLNVSCSERADEGGAFEREEESLERTGENIGEGVEDAGDEMEDAVD